MRDETQKPSAGDVAPRWLRRTLPVVVILIGVLTVGVLVKMRRRPQRQEITDRGMLVEVQTVRAEQRRVEVVGHGTVQPARQVVISPQVAGKVIAVAASFVIGGVIERGAVLVKVDPTDYRLSLQRARAKLAEARKALAEAESNAAVARREWEVLGKQAGGSREASPLTLHQPQLELARAGLEAAKAEVEQAEVNLERTVIRAPFNLGVREENVEAGQYIVVGQTLATVYGTDAAEVIVPLPVDELRWINVPRPLTTDDGSHRGVQPPPVRIKRNLGGKSYERMGALVRSVGEIDATGRMSKVVVRIDDPYNLKAPAANAGYQPDFEVGAFVEVEIEGQQLRHVVPIPADALRMGSIVWVVGPEERLQVRKVRVTRLTKREALVNSGLQTGDRIVLTMISGAVEGMRLRVKQAKHESRVPSAPSAEASRERSADKGSPQ